MTYFYFGIVVDWWQSIGSSTGRSDASVPATYCSATQRTSQRNFLVLVESDVMCVLFVDGACDGVG